MVTQRRHSPPSRFSGDPRLSMITPRKHSLRSRFRGDPGKA